MCVRQLFVLPTSKGIDPCGVGNEDFFPVVTLLLLAELPEHTVILRKVR